MSPRFLNQHGASCAAWRVLCNILQVCGLLEHRGWAHFAGQEAKHFLVRPANSIPAKPGPVRSPASVQKTPRCPFFLGFPVPHVLACPLGFGFPGPSTNP
jgi:hypothetical protein